MRVLAVLTGVLSMTGTVASLAQNSVKEDEPPSAYPQDLQNSEPPSKVPTEMGPREKLGIGALGLGGGLSLYLLRNKIGNFFGGGRGGKLLPQSLLSLSIRRSNLDAKRPKLPHLVLAARRISTCKSHLPALPAFPLNIQTPGSG